MRNKKLTPLEKISFSIPGLIGTPASLIIHSIVFIGIFSLRFLGIATDSILFVLATALSLEAIYLAIFIQMTINRNTQSLVVVEKDTVNIQGDEEKTRTVLIHIGQQMKAVQRELDTLRRASFFKSNGNGRQKIHA